MPASARTLATPGSSAPQPAWLHPPWPGMLHGWFGILGMLILARTLASPGSSAMEDLTSKTRYPSPTMQAFTKLSPDTLQVSFTEALWTKVDRSGADMITVLCESGLGMNYIKGVKEGKVLPTTTSFTAWTPLLGGTPPGASSFPFGMASTRPTAPSSSSPIWCMAPSPVWGTWSPCPLPLNTRIKWHLPSYVKLPFEVELPIE